MLRVAPEEEDEEEAAVDAIRRTHARHVGGLPTRGDAIVYLFEGGRRSGWGSVCFRASPDFAMSGDVEERFGDWSLNKACRYRYRAQD